MPVTEATLRLDQGTTPTWSLCWIAGGVSVNPTGATPTCLFRQTPTDAPLVEFTNIANANGSVITYAAAVPNSPIVVRGGTFIASPTIGEVYVAGDQILYLTLYPIVMAMSAADMELLTFPYMQAKLNLNWASQGVSMDVVHWQVEISNV